MRFHCTVVLLAILLWCKVLFFFTIRLGILSDETNVDAGALPL